MKKLIEMFYLKVKNGKLAIDKVPKPYQEEVKEMLGEK